jgi:LysM repeat protein
MIARGMTGWRNPARYLAPLAIAAVAAASYVIVHHALIDKHTSASLSIVQSTTSTHSPTTRRISTKAKFYFVRPNDTMSKIASRTGVSLSTLEQLNPNVNPDALHPQQRLRLRR